MLDHIYKSLAILAIIGTFIAFIGSMAFYADESLKSLERRTSVLEVTFNSQAAQLTSLAVQVEMNNNQQSKALLRVEDLMLSGFNRIEDKIEKIHTV